MATYPFDSFLSILPMDSKVPVVGKSCYDRKGNDNAIVISGVFYSFCLGNLQYNE